MWGRHCAYLVLAASGCAHAWITQDQRYQFWDLATIKARSQPSLSFLWTLPASTDSIAGLGTSISYAWDPAMCDTLLELFGENLWGFEFVDCETINDAMRRSFNAWAANHPLLSFHEVSKECVACGAACLYPNGLGPDGVGCSFAEIWLTTTGETDSADAAGVAKSEPVSTTSFRLTNGQGTDPSVTVYEQVGVTIGFKVTDGICWYLDPTFCERFHDLSGDPETWMPAILFILWAVSLLETMYQLFVFVLTQKRLYALERDDDQYDDHQFSDEAALEWQQTLNDRHMNTAISMLRLIFLIAPPLFYWQIFRPCFECYDFEAVATHEVGHALGLNHPQTADYCQTDDEGPCIPGNYETVGNVNPADCLNPWVNVEVANTAVPQSIMQPTTFNNPTTCIFQDDLDALYALYPVCADQNPIDTPQCAVATKWIGAVRFSAYVLFPAVLAVVVIMIVHLAQWLWHRIRRNRLRHHHADVAANSRVEAQQIKRDIKRMSSKRRKSEMAHWEGTPLADEVANMVIGKVKAQRVLQGIKNWKDRATNRSMKKIFPAKTPSLAQVSQQASYKHVTESSASAEESQPVRPAPTMPDPEPAYEAPPAHEAPPAEEP